MAVVGLPLSKECACPAVFEGRYFFAPERETRGSWHMNTCPMSLVEPERETEPTPPVIDLMQALKNSLAQRSEAQR
jgi:hypothetical protein